MFQSYYLLDNGKQVVDYVYKYNLQFCYGNCLKYCSRCGKKLYNSVEKDLNKALTYITSAPDEHGFLYRSAKNIYNSIKFDDSEKLADGYLDDILKAIIKYDDYKTIAGMIITYMKERGANVKSEFEKYRT